MPDQADICQLGLDQRKVNVLAREYCTKIKRKLKPVILSHEMLPGLLEVPHHSAIQNNFVRHFQYLLCCTCIYCEGSPYSLLGRLLCLHVCISLSQILPL